jgi:hypothetical protein
MAQSGSDMEISPVEFDGSNAADLYAHIESWWGVDLDDQLIERIANAPEEH